MIKTIVVSSLLFIALSTTSAYARFTVTPMQFALSSSTQETQSHTFTVTNNTKEKKKFNLYVNDYVLDRANRQTKFFPPNTLDRGCAGWLELEAEEIELLPGEAQELRVELSVPPDKEGDFWGYILVQEVTSNQLSKQQQGFVIRQLLRMAISVYVSIDDPSTPLAQLTALSVQAEDTTASLYHIAFSIENKSIRILTSTATIEIRDSSGNTVHTLTVPEFRCFVDKTRHVTIPAELKLDKGLYTALAIIDYDGDELLAGEKRFEVV